MKNIIRKASLVLILVGFAFAAAPQTPGLVPQSSQRLLTEVTDIPAFWWMVWWTGVGDVSDFLVSNAMQGGAFARHPDDEHEYRGELAYASTGQYPGVKGNSAEYPAESSQFYLYAMGLWFGAMYPDGEEWIPNVSKAAYNSDIGAMSVPEMEEGGGMGDISSHGLYFSDMRIPEGYEYSGEGDRLFAYPDETPKPYQIRWPFADTMLNKNRPPDEQLDPEKGDVVSHQDTYATGGDWIDVDSATCIWILSTGAYDVRGLGIRIEQRTYSWDHGALANSIVLNYKIRNMNDFVLQEPCFSYFVDPDIGEGGTSPGDEGFWDDMIGFDESRDLGYAYDNNGSEPGWSTPAGYVGAVLLETPGDVGMTGFETWQNGHEIDDNATDSIKYLYMTSTDFVTWENPNDVRMLLNSGSYPDMQPGDEYDFTLAVVLGETLEELQENADSVIAIFDEGFPWFDPLGIEEPETTVPVEHPDIHLASSNITDGFVPLRYSLPYSSNINLAVFDPTGRKITTLYQGQADVGTSEVSWDASAAPAGVYFVRLQAGNQSCTERVLIIR
jgi:hypothetical protein